MPCLKWCGLGGLSGIDSSYQKVKALDGWLVWFLLHPVIIADHFDVYKDYGLHLSDIRIDSCHMPYGNGFVWA